MATTIFTSDSVGSGPQATLDDNESAYVRAGVFVSASAGAAILGSGTHETAVVYGDVVGGGTGINLGDTESSDAQEYVYVHAGASVTGLGSSGGAVSIVGFNSLIRNEGNLFGAYYGVLLAGDSMTTQSTLQNSGTIEGTQFGVSRGLGYGSGETLIIENTGTIRGEIDSFSHQYSTASEQITNSGTMIGNIDFGGGADFYDGTLGHFKGSILGGDDADTIYGGGDKETISGGAGADLLDGGANADTLDYGISPAAVTINLATGIASGGDATGDDFSNFEAIIGSSYSDRLTGDIGNNTLTGGVGNDFLVADAGDDVLVGGVGRDVLTGGAGRDIMTGGASADQFIFLARTDSSPGKVHDLITDFSQADGDKIDLSAIDANNQTTPNDTFTFVGTAAFSSQAGELHIAYSGPNATLVEADIDGNGTADIQIQLTGHLTLVAGDFVL